LPDWVAFTIFGVASAIGGVLALLLPESLGAPLPDTFQDIEVCSVEDYMTMYSTFFIWKIA
jgi:hypothetical protein